MSDAPMDLLAKLDGGRDPVLLLDSDIQTLARYLGVDVSPYPNEKRVEFLRGELFRQNMFLSRGVVSNEAEQAEMYNQSAYVREVLDRKNRGKIAEMHQGGFDRRASLQDVEKALATVCEVMDYPLYVANATEDRRVIKFVAELAAEVFSCVQVKFKELRVRVENEVDEK